jgi:hypothetical protein
MNGDDARIVCEGDVNLLWIGAKYSVNMPSGIVTKPPKPVSSVSAVRTWGIFRNFSLFCGVGGLYGGGIFLRSAPIIAAGPKGGLVHPKNLWWAWARGDQRPEFIADW